jgi:hypothetical protein
MPIAHWAVRRRPPELGDRNLAPTHSLAHLEALELRMVDVERLVLARALFVAHRLAEQGGVRILDKVGGIPRRPR